MISYLQKWKDIGEANDVGAALADHFSYLVDVQGFEPVLHALMREALDVKYTEEYLAVKFRGNETLLAYAPLEEIPDHYPDGYRKLLEQHRLIELEQQRILLGEHGYIDELDGWYDAFEEAELPAGITPARKRMRSNMVSIVICMTYITMLKGMPKGIVNTQRQ